MFETIDISEILTYQHQIGVFVLSVHLALGFHLNMQYLWNIRVVIGMPTSGLIIICLFHLYRLHFFILSSDHLCT